MVLLLTLLLKNNLRQYRVYKTLAGSWDRRVPVVQVLRVMAGLRECVPGSVL